MNEFSSEMMETLTGVFLKHGGVGNVQSQFRDFFVAVARESCLSSISRGLPAVCPRVQRWGPKQKSQILMQACGEMFWTTRV